MAKTKVKIVSGNNRYIVTVNALRTRNFNKNLPFLILSKRLPEGQVFREFPDGRIELQEVFTEGAKFSHKVLKVLPEEEAEAVRMEYGLQ